MQKPAQHVLCQPKEKLHCMNAVSGALCLARSRNICVVYLERILHQTDRLLYLYLDAGTTSEARADVAVTPPVGASGKDGNEPEKRTSEVNPHGILHAHDVAVTVSLLLDVSLY